MGYFFILRLTISFDEASSGVACDLESRGFHVLCKATEEVVGHVKPYSITGTLPLIRELQVRLLFILFFVVFPPLPPPLNIYSFYLYLILCSARMKDSMFKLPAMV